MKKPIKLLAKPVIKSIDVALARPALRRKATAIASRFLSRYTNNGIEIDLAGPQHYTGPWNFMLDTPKLAKTNDKKAYVSGWFVPNEDVSYKLRLVCPDKKIIAIKSDIKRFDVAEALSQRLKRQVNENTGFGVNIVVESDGEYIVEVKIEKEWLKLATFDLRYDPDFIVTDIFNGNLAQNYAAHRNLIANKKQYFYESKTSSRYTPHADDAKLVAFYLPQFHPFKENDEWWGKGFTEWSNVASALPRYVGHEQPKLPGDLGFYDLRIAENMEDQIRLAKQHGIHAFCLYYYWFSGKKLMETPINHVMQHKEWDFNFMICWANENWTRRWDGRNQDVLIAQAHNPEDPLKFIQDVEDILLDDRYMRVDGKPVLAVYRAEELDGPDNYAKVWREYFKTKHGLGLHLLTVQGFTSEPATKWGFDKGIEFAPLTISARLKNNIPRFNIIDKILDVEFTGAMFDYRQIALKYADKQPQSPAYRSLMPAWDNDARRKGSGGVFADSNPDLYGKWLDKLLSEVNSNDTPSDEKLIFVNAWNEWAEGAFLEPDVQNGHAYLRRTAEVLSAHSKNKENAGNFPLYDIRRSPETDLAVILHLYYPDMWTDFEKSFKRLGSTKYDLYVTLGKKNEYMIDVIKKSMPNATVNVVPNRGRDVLPFIHLARRLEQSGYKRFLKLHSKKSIHRGDGNMWLDDMLKKLIPNNEKKLKHILSALNSTDTGIIGPMGHYISLNAYFGSNEQKTFDLLVRTKGEKRAKQTINNLNKYGFFAGTMFWGRLDAIKPLLDLYLQPSDFEPEAGQVDSTFAHAMERCLSVIPFLDDKNLYSTEDGRVLQVSGSGITSEYAYAKNKEEELKNK